MKTTILAAVLAFASHAALAGTITNGSFNDGLNGWTTFGAVSVHDEGGNNVAQLTSGMGTDVYTTLSQNVYLNAGDVLTGRADFLAGDYLTDFYSYNDDAFVSLNGVNLFHSDIAQVGDFGTTGWVNFSFTVLTSGTYVLEAGVANHTDNEMNSTLKVDGFSLPEPGSVALFGLGLLGAALARRRRA